MRAVFTPRAVRQFESLHRYITEHGGEAVADGYVDRIVAHCQHLEIFPQRGTRRDDILPGLRLVGFERRATIAFLVDADGVVIEGIFYGGQDLNRRLTKAAR